MMQAKEVFWRFKGSLHIYQGVDKMANIFQMYFFNDYICILIQTSLKCVPSNWQWVKIGSADSLVPLRWQANT